MVSVDIFRDMPAYAPNSATSGIEEATRIALQTANQVLPFLSALAETVHRSTVTPIEPSAFLPIDECRASADQFKSILDSHGSDKASFHAYHEVYTAILRDRAAVERVMEIGLGTNNTDVASNMGHQGRPGASLRAFRDFLPNAQIYGADIDRRILFTEPRIETFFVDQTSRESFADLARQVPGDFDLVIDDGLHAMNANLATLEFGLGKIKPRGWVVVEDIPDRALPLWSIVTHLLPNSYTAQIVRTRTAFMFVVQRLR